MERTASRSVSALLLDRGFTLVGDHHGGPTEAHPIVGIPFTVVRNHWDILVSFWYAANGQFFNDPPIPFQWFANHFMRNPEMFKAGRLFRFLTIPQIQILRYETLQDDLDELFMEHGLEPGTLELTGESAERQGAHYSGFYDEPGARFVAWAFEQEIRYLAYRFEVPR